MAPPAEIVRQVIADNCRAETSSPFGVTTCPEVALAPDNLFFEVNKENVEVARNFTIKESLACKSTRRRSARLHARPGVSNTLSHKASRNTRAYRLLYILNL